MKTMSADIDRMLCFAAVAEHGSFTAAAAALGCSKAHVSRQVAELEQALGAQLLLRTTRRLSLTALGHRHAEDVGRLRAAYEDARQRVAAERDEVRGVLRITTATTFGETFLVDLVRDFMARHPQVDVEIDTSIVVRDLFDGRWDFAFRAARVVDEHLVVRAVGMVREIAVAAPALLAGREPPRRPADLASLPALRNSHFSDDAEWVFVRGGDSGTVRPHGRLAINNFAALQRAAERGVGMARLPFYLVHDALAEGRLVRLLPDWEIAQLPMALVHPQRRHPTRLQQAFRSFALAWFEAPERQALLR